MEIGFPELTDSFLAGQDILYSQFNEIEFYVEDTNQEYFYYNILKRLFYNIKFEKIFPLNGKKNVQDLAAQNINNKKKVFIVDLDFDEILGLKKNLKNLFYLERYSIENYLISKNAIFELIREKESSLKDHEIEPLFEFHKEINESTKLLRELSSAFILIQKHSLGKEYFGLNPARDFNLTSSPPSYKNKFIADYLIEVNLLLKGIDKRYSLNSQIRKLKTNFNNLQKSLKLIPGKYLLLLIKYKLERLGMVYQVSLESFAYKLSKECDLSEFLFLKKSIVKYIK